MRVDGLDHLVLTVRDVDATGAFYARARGPLRSIYIRDPDGNLIEIANAVVPGEGGGPR